ncbi:MAG: tRNA lysidine(34) synthetase TilS [Candidatus Omnitrophica bacterium]|nr:tRNA lysidine(34) synthetase TilS [Candidatus Omnitrophota bacterium]
MPATFLDKIRSTIKKYRMLDRHDSVLVGLSGGPDSVALLHALAAIKQDYSLKIYIAHIDHMFRGEESKQDRKFCQDLAESMGLTAFCEERDIPKIAEEKGMSSEEVARLERYEFFFRVARENSVDKIAVGHTKDDQAETILMRMIRGSGLSGLGGMNPVKDMKGMVVIRPLINATRQEIEGFIKECGLKCRHDSSNDEVVFTRNKVRHELIPYLEDRFNPNIKEVLVNMAENLRTEDEFLEKFSSRKFKIMSKKSRSGYITVDIGKFKKQPHAIKKRIIRSALKELKGDLRRFTYQHWKEIEELVNARPVNSVVDLPGGIDIKKEKGAIIFKKV